MPPSSLQTLLNLQSPSNFAQSVPAYTPNIGRNAARVGALRRVFGLEGPDTGEISQSDLESAYGETLAEQQAQAAIKAQAEAFPYQVKGQYDVERERVRAEAQAREQMRREQVAQEQTRQRQDFQGSQRQLDREAIMGRQEAAGARSTARQAQTQEAINARQRAAQAARRAELLRTGKEPVSGTGLRGMFGMGKSAEQVRAELLQSLTPSTDVMDLVADYAPFAMRESDDDLYARIAEEQPEASPDEIAQLIAAIRGVR
jgi:hypothetical protein